MDESNSIYKGIYGTLELKKSGHRYRVIAWLAYYLLLDP